MRFYTLVFNDEEPYGHNQKKSNGAAYMSLESAVKAVKFKGFTREVEVDEDFDSEGAVKKFFEPPYYPNTKWERKAKSVTIMKLRLEVEEE